VRTNIVIDDNLMKKTLRATGLKTKRGGGSCTSDPATPEKAGQDPTVSR
jgi:hypothetical protein